MAKLKLKDLKKLVKMTAEEAIDYSVNKGVAIADDYDDTIELINDQADTLGANAKMRLLQLLLDIVDEVETMEQLQNDFAEQTASGGWTAATPSVSDQTISQAGYSSYSDSRYKEQSEYPYLLYSAVIDGATTQGCVTLNNKIFSDKDTKFRKNLYPPRHWGCRSVVVAFKEYRGTLSNATSFVNLYADAVFQKTTKVYTFMPKAKDFNDALFKAFKGRKNLK